MFNSTAIRENPTSLIADVLNCCPTLVQHQLMQHIQLKHLHKNTLFIQPGDKLEGIYLVLEGGIKLYQQKDRVQQILNYHSPKDIIGLSVVINSTPANYYACTMKDTVLAFIPATVLVKLMSSHPLSFLSLMKKLNEKTERIENRGASMMTDPPEETVIKAVNDLKNRFGTDHKGYIQVHIPVRELAGYLGMSKTNLYRTLQSLKAQHILSHHMDKYKLEKNIPS